MGKIFGYVRVSTKEQNTDRQMIAMRNAGVAEENIFVDKMSGKDFSRSAYRRMIKKLSAGAIIYVKSIDRLGRNYEEIIDEWRRITKEKGADIVVLDMPLLDTRRDKNLLGTFISDIVLQLLSFVAENERSMIRQRQAEGIAAAKARGVKFGRPRAKVTREFYYQAKILQEGRATVTEAARNAGMSRSVFYRRAMELQAYQARHEKE